MDEPSPTSGTTAGSGTITDYDWSIGGAPLTTGVAFYLCPDSQEEGTL